jgi:hypothetical protein
MTLFLWVRIILVELASCKSFSKNCVSVRRTNPIILQNFLRVSRVRTLYECCVQHAVETGSIWVFCAFLIIHILWSLGFLGCINPTMWWLQNMHCVRWKRQQENRICFNRGLTTGLMWDVFVIQFYLQSVPVHSANCVKIVYSGM